MKDILNMSEEQLNIECARFMNDDIYDGIFYDNIPLYSKSLDLMYQVEEKIKEMGLILEYVYNVTELASNNIPVRMIEKEFNSIHASPLDRLKAVLLTIEEGE